jgi:hypothetical protein
MLATHRHVIACVCIVVNPSCKHFTSIQTHQSEQKQRIVMSLRAFVLQGNMQLKHSTTCDLGVRESHM